MAKQAITLKLAGKSYSLTIDSEKEEAYRLAEREVNRYLASIKQKNYEGWSEYDYLSMTALKFAISSVNMQRGHRIDDSDTQRLEQLGNEIDTYLNTLRK